MKNFETKLNKESFERFSFVSLDKSTAEAQVGTIKELVNQIPMVEYSEEQILAEQKGDRKLLGKWERSFIVYEKKTNKPVGIIIGYEREGENNGQYPQNTIYISELSVLKDYQQKGLGKKLLELFLEANKQRRMRYLEGGTNFSVQTNSAEWNKSVIDPYKSFGFKERATKEYDNRVDLIMRLEEKKEND